ncbi:uncharacterized protein MJAP1_000485 [Malassezia japonica]|uniref:DSC E3 ubiquitin ligase complex subunit 3 C-terminal domain-containing protein n=1 Tax=Malassezia japonica TaxID=223818 RepID=A0AAF0F0E3_9BASI|nr:uncharacterized protein MJAP1_000485 [Malassezia japonica]WFD37541.1 hypothetical protein MJAP1_000485 [Malassezia japonica]
MSSALVVRPLVVRFTDAHTDDAHLDLIYEQRYGDAKEWPNLHEETVAELKDVLRAGHPDRAERRLRLIHFGRILPNGVHLASYLDSIVQMQEADTSEAVLEHVTVHVEPRIDGSYVLRRPNEAAETMSSKQWGKQRAEVCGDEQSLPPSGFASLDVLRLPAAYLQCSIGAQGAEEPEEEQTELPRTDPEPRGFDRLRHTAGMSAMDIQIMREHFHQRSGLSMARSGDLVRRQEEDELAYTLEEQWIDNMGETPEALVNANASSTRLSVLQGLLIGFFFPLLPLFFAYGHGAVRWPRPPQQAQQDEEMERLFGLANVLSELRNRPTDTQGPPTAQDAALRNEAQQSANALLSLIARRSRAPAARDADDDDDDDEEELPSEGGTEAPPVPRRGPSATYGRYVIFSPYTHIAILIGFVINIALGLFRMLW